MTGNTIRGSPSRCKDCQHWTRHSEIWGTCDIAATGTFRHRKGYICKHTQAREQNQLACKVRFIQKEGETVFYYYGMRLRGFSPGCQPLVGFHHRMDDPTGRYHDVLVYTRELTEQELKAYELDFIR